MTPSDTTDPETSPVDPPVGTLECEDDPDPAAFVEGEIPPANRPCSLPTALQVQTIRSGVGRNAQDGDTVIADFTGIRAEDAELFDSSYPRGVPMQFQLGRGGVIQGWDDGLVSAQAGSLVKLNVPGELAYGENPPGGVDSPIGPGDALTFVIEVHAVIPPVTADDAPLDIDIEPSLGAAETTVVVVRPGDGATVGSGDTVVVHLLLVRGDNEVVLFSTWDESDPLQIIVEEGQSLPGVVEGLQGARVGSLVSIAMPPADAFGEEGNAGLGLPAGVDLIAVVEIVGVY